MIVAAVLNFLLFFSLDIWRSVKHGHRRMRFQARATAGRRHGGKLVHECRVCGLTSETAQRTQFRYCSQCDGEACYCPEHLDAHDHVRSDRGQESAVRSQENQPN
jgi:hypothetical protein